MDRIREELLTSYIDFLQLSFAMAQTDSRHLLPACEAMGRAVIAALPDADIAVLHGRLQQNPTILFDGDKPVDAPLSHLKKLTMAQRDALSFSGDHPAWTIQAICTDTRKHFGLAESDLPDIDEQLLIDYLSIAFRRRFGSAATQMAPMDLENIISILPTEYVMANTRLSDELSSGKTEEGEHDIVVKAPKKKSDKPVLTKAILTFGDDKAVITATRQKYTPYDSAVYSGIITLFEAENNIFTPAMVYRAMNGLTDSEYVNPSTLSKVAKSIEKNRKSQLAIDFTDEARQYMRAYEEPARDFKTTYEGNLLVADKITVKNNGVEQTAYKILRKPILYEYAQTVEQVISVPIKLLQTKGSVRSTEDVIVLREYLLRQIENYRRRHREGSFSISYLSVYEVCGVSAESHKNIKDKHKKIRSHTEALLSEWQKQSYIKHFENQRDGTRSIASVQITI
ncbi:MAG: hypothetical protein Q4E65_08495 [Clostridia bacterium]|nr:hypothetical protein [Clostridia bacterium]